MFTLRVPVHDEFVFRGQFTKADDPAGRLIDDHDVSVRGVRRLGGYICELLDAGGAVVWPVDLLGPAAREANLVRRDVTI